MAVVKGKKTEEKHILSELCGPFCLDKVVWLGRSGLAGGGLLGRLGKAFTTKKAEETEGCLNYRKSCGGEDDWNKAWNSKNERHYGIWLKRTLIKAKAFSGIYASRREIT